MFRPLITCLLVFSTSLLAARPELRSAKCGEYDLRIVWSKSLDADQLQIRKGKDMVELRTSMSRYEIGGSEEISPDAVVWVGQDLSNSGAPHVVVYESNFSGRRFVAHLWRMGPERPELLASIPGMADFERDAATGYWFSNTGDFVFQSWLSGPNFSAIPSIKLSWDVEARGMRPNASLMRRNAPKPAELDKLIADTKARMAEYDHAEGKMNQLNMELLNLLYSGNAPAAQILLDATFPPTADRERYDRELGELLSRSEYWQLLKIAGFPSLSPRAD
jgi:hypothetical protein